MKVNCPSKDQGTTCFKCDKKGYITKNCVNPKEGEKVCVISDGGNRSTTEVVIGRRRITCQVDSGGDHIVMRYDFFLKVKNKAGVMTLPGALKTFVGAVGHFSTWGRARVPTVIGGTKYELEYRIVDREVISVQVQLVNPLLDQAVITLLKTGSQIQPLVGEGYVLMLCSEKPDRGADLSNLPEEYVERVGALINGYTPVEGKKCQFQ